MVPTATEQALLEAVVEGEVLNLTPEGFDESSPSDVQTWEDRTLSASFLRQLCATTRWDIHPRGVRLVGARVEGDLDLEACEVRSIIYLRNCLLNGDISLRGARSKRISFFNCVASNINADGLIADGDFELMDGFQANGEIALVDAQIRGSLACKGATLSNADGFALVADGVEVRGSVFLSDFLSESFVAEGEVRLPGAEIRGGLTCRGEFHGSSKPDSYAIHADHIVIGADAWLDHGFHAEGEVSFVGARLGGSLDCTAASFSNPYGHALDLDRAEVANYVFLGTGFSARGEVRLLRAEVGGSIECRGGRFSAPYKASEPRPALNCDGVRVNDSLLLDGGFEAHGEVRIVGATIEGSLQCESGVFANSGGSALAADRVKVRDNVVLDGMQADGMVRLMGAAVDGRVTCQSASFFNHGDVAFAAEQMRVSREFVWRGISIFGGLDVAGTFVGTLADDEASWPDKGKLVIDGFRYGDIAGPSLGWKSRRYWLSLQGDPKPQPYLQLASVYRARGERAAARKISMERHNANLRRSWLSRLNLWRQVLRFTIGHGYEPWRSLIWFGVLLVVGALAFADAAERDAMIPLRASDGAQGILCGGGNAPSESPAVIFSAEETESAVTQPALYPCLQPLVYSLDALIPVLDLHQKEYWLPDSSTADGRRAALVFWVLITAGWGLTTIVLAGFTNLVKRE